MNNTPPIDELVLAVQRFIADTARPNLKGHAAFHARVAENALAIVLRELHTGAAAREAAKERLKGLLPECPSDDLDTLTRALSDALRSGTLDHSTPGLLGHLKATAIDELGIDQPQYSGLAIATKRRDS